MGLQFELEKVEHFLAYHKAKKIDLEYYALRFVKREHLNDFLYSFIKATYPNASKHFQIEFTRALGVYLVSQAALHEVSEESTLHPVYADKFKGNA